MNKFWLWAILAGAYLAGTPVRAEDSLAAWAQSIEKPETQQLILSRVFGGTVGPPSAAVVNKETGDYLFPQNDFWVQLGKDVVYVSSTSTGGPYLIVSYTSYRRPNQEPVSTTSYIFFDPAQRPTAISGGYARHEQVQLANLTKLNRSFLVLVDMSGRGNAKQWSGFVLAFEGTSKPRTVWLSPISARNFQFGFDLLGGTAEELIFKTTKGGEVQYSAYRWNGNRFEPDSFASESRLKALPESAWTYGTGS